MKTLICIMMSGLMCVGFASCNDDEDMTQSVTPYEKQYGEATVMWDATHQSLFNFKGSPQVVQESEEGTNEDMTVFNTTRKYVFDDQGHLLEYDPVGNLANMHSTFAGEWGGAGDVTKYAYKYDAAGKLIKVIETELGGEPVTYSLDYGTHSVYVPFPLSFGKLPLFLLKGLSLVEGDNGFRYEYDGEKAFSEEDSWIGVIRTEYSFRGAYPIKCLKQLIRGENVLQEDETVYAFGEKGTLLGTTTTIVTLDEPEDIRKETFIYASPWLQVKESTKEAGLMQEKYIYDYTEDGFLVSVMKSDNENNSASVHLNSYKYDTAKNWIYAERIVENYFNDYWPEGTMILKRDFLYK